MSGEAADSWTAHPSTTCGFSLIGCERGMVANQLSYFFDLKGKNKGKAFNIV